MAFLSTRSLQMDRTTTIYGTMTDINQQPVDSILVSIHGLRGLTSEPMGKEIFSDKDGHYQLVMEVPKKFPGIDVGIPFGTSINPKFQKYYKGHITYNNEIETINCCRANIGQKTRYDFQLIAR
tara:strand:+ start:612 stop:983 length:372 start_codon:yes stop_codon:yes gene_type:complete